MKTYHFAFLGNECVGKTTFITRYQNIVPSFYLPGEQQYLHLISVQHDDGISDVILWKWAESPMIKQYLNLSLTFASVIYICYSVSDPSSLYDAHKYLQFVNREKQVVILVGMKIDLRNNFILNCCLTFEDGFSVSNNHNFDGFVECSALDDINCFNVLSLGIKLDNRKQIMKIDIPYYKKIFKTTIMFIKTLFSACFSPSCMNTEKK